MTPAHRHIHPFVHRPQAALPRPQAALALLLLISATGAGCATVGAGPPSGGTEDPDSDEKAAMTAMGKAVTGKIVWSSSRVGNHDLFVMNTDGSQVEQITKGDKVDWFPRFSPDGSRILFTRSKKGWVFERDANSDGKWDIYSVASDGSDETKVVNNASWGSWISNDEIVYARVTRVYKRALAGGEETLLVDSDAVSELDGALVQQPEMSSDGKYVAITLRGAKRETGIWDIEKKTWTRTGEGCQVNWTPAGDEIYWVHPTGNGGSRVLHMPVNAGKPAQSDADADADALTLVDIPGRRSHEYFPQLSADGKWLVWAATQRGHDHDIADYEIYLWKVGAEPKAATRLTYHSGNDRWPDIFIAGAGGSKASAPATKGETGGTSDVAATASDDDDDNDDDDGASPATGKQSPHAKKSRLTKKHTKKHAKSKKKGRR